MNDRRLKRGDWVIYLTWSCDPIRIGRFSGYNMVGPSLLKMEWLGDILHTGEDDILAHHYSKRGLRGLLGRMKSVLRRHYEAQDELNKDKPAKLTYRQWYEQHPDLKTVGRKKWSDTLAELRKIGKEV